MKNELERREEGRKELRKYDTNYCTICVIFVVQDSIVVCTGVGVCMHDC